MTSALAGAAKHHGKSVTLLHPSRKMKVRQQKVSEEYSQSAFHIFPSLHLHRENPCKEV
jgi:hypothetical protein